MTTITNAAIVPPVASASRMFAMLFFVLCSSGALAQQSKVITPARVIEHKVAATDTQMELLFWVMGSRQGRTINPETTRSHKKQMINSGMAPNRILSRTFLNKAINYDNTIS